MQALVLMVSALVRTLWPYSSRVQAQPRISSGQDNASSYIGSPPEGERNKSEAERQGRGSSWAATTTMPTPAHPPEITTDHGRVERRNEAEPRSGVRSGVERAEYKSQADVPEVGSTSHKSAGHSAARAIHSAQSQEQRSSELNERCLRLQDEVNKLQHQLRRAESEAKQATQQLAQERQARSELETEMNGALAQAETKLREAKQRANAARGFEEGDADDAQKLIQRFGDVVEAVNDLVFNIVDKFSDHESNMPLNIESLLALAERDQRYADIQPYVFSMVHLGGDPDTVALHVLQSLVFAVLVNSVFLPFCPGLRFPHEFEKAVLSMRKFVSQKEPQERFGRWQGILYQAIQAHYQSNHAQRVTDLVNDLFARIDGILRALLTSRRALVNIHEGLEPFKTEAVKIVEQAIEFQNSAKVDYASYEYLVFLPFWKEEYDSKTGERVDLGDDFTLALADLARSHNATNRVLLSTSIGLKASRKGEDGVYQQTVVRKAAVVAA